MSTHQHAATHDDPIGSPHDSMEAVVQDRYGSAEALHRATVDRPATGADDVLIRVRAAGVHIGDWHLMTGQPYLMRIMGFGLRAPKARVRGTDVAGTVVAVGANVTEVRAGDEVFGTCDGSYAEYTTARTATLALKPANLTFRTGRSRTDVGGHRPERHLRRRSPHRGTARSGHRRLGRGGSVRGAKSPRPSVPR